MRPPGWDGFRFCSLRHSSFSQLRLIHFGGACSSYIEHAYIYIYIKTIPNAEPLYVKQLGLLNLIPETFRDLLQKDLRRLSGT